MQHKHCLRQTGFQIVLHLIIANGHAGVLTYYSSVLIFLEKRLVASVSHSLSYFLNMQKARVDPQLCKCKDFRV